MAEETQLIDRALEGDRAAFTRLVELNQDRLFASMLQVTGSADEAEDVVQEAFIRAFMKLDTFQRNSLFFTWLYRIAFNSALTRRRRKQARVSLDSFRDNSGLEVVDRGDAVDESMLRNERVAMVRQALQTLTEEHRNILVLREMQDHSYEEIAEILDISIGTVRSRLSRARRQLKLAVEAMQRSEENERVAFTAVVVCCGCNRQRYFRDVARLHASTSVFAMRSWQWGVALASSCLRWALPATSTENLAPNAVANLDSREAIQESSLAIRATAQTHDHDLLIANCLTTRTGFDQSAVCSGNTCQAKMSTVVKMQRM